MWHKYGYISLAVLPGAISGLNEDILVRIHHLCQCKVKCLTNMQAAKGISPFVLRVAVHRWPRSACSTGLLFPHDFRRGSDGILASWLIRFDSPSVVCEEILL